MPELLKNYRNRYSKMRFCILFISFVILLASPLDSFSQELSQTEAVKLAEEFIKINGYTAEKVVYDEKKITLESIEWSSDLREIFESRHNTLQSKAYGILQGRKNDSKGYTVIFRYIDSSIEKTGRAVTMDLDGKKIRVEHVDIFLRAAEKIL